MPDKATDWLCFGDTTLDAGLGRDSSDQLLTIVQTYVTALASPVPPAPGAPAVGAGLGEGKDNG